MRRVLVSASAFRLSAPGFDAASASANQLIFDGFGQYAYNGVYLAGFFASSSMVNVGNAYQGIVNFGKTFAAPPQCVVRMLDVNHQNARAACYFVVAGTSGQGVGPIRFTITTTSLVVYVPFTNGTNYPTQVGFSYIAMQV